MKRILVISPHADDAELWAGASISRWVREGAEVHHLILTASNGRGMECSVSSAVLGMQIVGIRSPVFTDTRLHEDRRHLLSAFESVSKSIKPHLVLCPSSTDMHQDHRTVYEEAFRAFRGVSTLGYDVPLNSHNHRNTYYVEVTKEDLDRKIEACQCYESESNKRYFDPEQIRALARVRGAEARVEFAEAFEQIRWIERI